MARDLGAQVVSLTDRNVSDALIRFAQQEGISHVVFGQSARSRWDIFLRGSVVNRFLSEVRDVTVQVVPMQTSPCARVERPPFEQPANSKMCSINLLCVRARLPKPRKNSIAGLFCRRTRLKAYP